MKYLLVAVVLIIAASLRSWRRVLAVCEPLALSVLLTMGLLALIEPAVNTVGYFFHEKFWQLRQAKKSAGLLHA